MAYQHQSLLWLPDALRGAGIHVIELDGWKENKQGYYWTDPSNKHHGYLGEPNGWLWHHTATTAYTPYVRNSKGQTKANLWFGLWRGEASNRLYSTGSGTPTVVVTSAGPGNYTAGSGKRFVLNSYVSKDRRFMGPQRNSDDSPKFYGNRYYGSTEAVHPGDGSPLDTGVWRAQYITASLMSQHWGWSSWRHVGHLDHTRRKIDPRFEQGAAYTIGLMQEAVQGHMAGVVTPPPIEPPPIGDEYEMKTIKRGDGYNSKGTAALKPTVISAQSMLAYRGFADENTSGGDCAADGVFGSGTEASVKNFQRSALLLADGVVGPATWAMLEG